MEEICFPIKARKKLPKHGTLEEENVIDMGTKKKKQPQTNVMDSRVWCNGFACRCLLCIHHPSSIPKRYRNSVFRYVDSNNFEDCKRWEAVAALREHKKKLEKGNENKSL